jgi:hypothetical protein
MTAYAAVHDDRRYKWVALSNTTLGLLMATINSSIVLIAMPDIFRGIGIDPLAGPATPATCCGCSWASWSSRPCWSSGSGGWATCTAASGSTTSAS